MQGKSQEEMTLQEASLLYEVEDFELALWLGQLEHVTRRLVKHGDTTVALYRRSEIEDAISRQKARLLGFTE